jgi:hypothetical protein
VTLQLLLLLHCKQLLTDFAASSICLSLEHTHATITQLSAMHQTIYTHICGQVAALVDRLRQNFTGKSAEGSRFSSRRSSKDPSRNGSPRAPPAFLPTPQQFFSSSNFNSNSSHLSGEGGRESSVERSSERSYAHTKPPVPRTQDWSSNNSSSGDAMQQQQQQQQQQHHRRQHSKGACNASTIDFCNVCRNNSSENMWLRSTAACSHV